MVARRDDGLAEDGGGQPAGEAPAPTPGRPDREAWIDALARLAHVPFMEEGRGQPPCPVAEAIDWGPEPASRVAACFDRLDRDGAATFLEGWERDQPAAPPVRDLDD